MGPYRLVSMDVTIEFDDGNDDDMIHGIDFIAVPVIAGRYALQRAKDLASAVYADPMMIASHESFKRFPFRHIRFIKTSIKEFKSNEIRPVHPYKPLQLMQGVGETEDAETKTETLMSYHKLLMKRTSL